MRKVFYAALLSAVLLVGIAFGVTAQNTVGAFFAPFIVDIEQSAPFEISVVAPLEDGEMITATMPMTVNVALQVSVEGPGLATVTLLDAEAPTVAIAESTVDGQLVDASGTPYKVEAPKSLVVLQAQFTKDRYGGYIVIGEVKNVGSSAVRYGKAIVTLYDAETRIVAVETTYLHISTLEPGKISTFEARFGDDITGIGSYSIRIAPD